MLSCKQCGRVIANVSPRKNFTVCLKCNREKNKPSYDIQEVAKKRLNAIWGKIHDRQELLATEVTKKEALETMKKLRGMKYFNKWKLWIEREAF